MTTTMDLILAIMTITVPLFGGIFTVLIFYKRDEEKEPKKIVMQTFLWGLLAGGIIIAITIPMFMGVKRIIDKINKEWAIMLFMIAIVIIQAALEEIIKAFFLRRRCLCKIAGEIDGLYDGFFYGAILGTGAGVVDAIAYALLATDWMGGLEIALIKTIRIPGTHALFTGFLGMYCAWHRFKEKKVFMGIAYAIILHIIWNAITYIFYYFLIGIVFYIANFAFLALYLVIMVVLSGALIKYDRKTFPEGISDEEKMKGTKCKI
ncbi:MAG TPA: PrsW family glutamic-type intramembrane protease [Candidatus Bathyarchaeia archaeon]|nr:PrsW family glutamic-type intramembrane protease [Candidatus Bathyarchaeia archaeon]